MGMGEIAVFWTQTRATDVLVWSMELSVKNARMAIQNTTGHDIKISVRCIKD